MNTAAINRILYDMRHDPEWQARRDRRAMEDRRKKEHKESDRDG